MAGGDLGGSTLHSNEASGMPVHVRNRSIQQGMHGTRQLEPIGLLSLLHRAYSALGTIHPSSPPEQRRPTTGAFVKGSHLPSTAATSSVSAQPGIQLQTRWSFAQDCILLLQSSRLHDSRLLESPPVVLLDTETH